jgi:lysozyme family protein
MEKSVQVDNLTTDQGPEGASGYDREVPLNDDQHNDLPNSADDVAGFGALEGDPPTRVAKSLKTLRRQVDAAAPGRSIRSDGTKGDGAHANRKSDHNPWVFDGTFGVVTAIDITHDKPHLDSERLAETLRRSRDQRIKYIISNRKIASASAKGSVPAWTWRAYTGSNPHDKHCHLSVSSEKARYDSEADWPIAGAFGTALEGEDHRSGPDDDVRLVDAAVRSLAALAEDENLSLLQRLKELEDQVEALRLRYLEASRTPAQTDDAALEGAPAFEQIRGEYDRLFAGCAVRSDRAGEVAWYRKMILKGRAQYEEASARCGVPWWFIAVIHGMEAGFSFKGHLHNGDPLTAQTVQVPRGRPKIWNPPNDWLSSAIDALNLAGFTGETDWSVARALYRWEQFNGFGYRRPAIGIPSPYLWSFSNHYEKGKYVADGSYSASAISKQCGTAVMLKALQKAGDVVL